MYIVHTRLAGSPRLAYTTVPNTGTYVGRAAIRVHPPHHPPHHTTPRPAPPPPTRERAHKTAYLGTVHSRMAPPGAPLPGPSPNRSPRLRRISRGRRGAVHVCRTCLPTYVGPLCTCGVRTYVAGGPAGAGIYTNEKKKTRAAPGGSGLFHVRKRRRGGTHACGGKAALTALASHPSPASNSPTKAFPRGAFFFWSGKDVSPVSRVSNLRSGNVKKKKKNITWGGS
ncbi:hypothetical protein BDY21DRAFT_70303 [Lineolata rhizophorae]|uniref:Uncharacterized protein n=1 Tax=Lineolata rhizophorae TaxID=578093 RepID=A0A6A6NV83_9PEZI|nr:hypothetical protein BDY21DRAFT_70303 [Lineolata rhizophorae]